MILFQDPPFGVNQLSRVHIQSGDIWVEGSRKYKYFEDYLISVENFREMKHNQDVGLNITLDSQKYFNQRLGESFALIIYYQNIFYQ